MRVLAQDDLQGSVWGFQFVQLITIFCEVCNYCNAVRRNWNVEGIDRSDNAFLKTLLNLPLRHTFVVSSVIAVSFSRTKGDLQICETEQTSESLICENSVELRSDFFPCSIFYCRMQSVWVMIYCYEIIFWQHGIWPLISERVRVSAA